MLGTVLPALGDLALQTPDFFVLTGTPVLQSLEFRLLVCKSRFKVPDVPF